MPLNYKDLSELLCPGGQSLSTEHCLGCGRMTLRKEAPSVMRGLTCTGGQPVPPVMLRGGALYLQDGQFFMVSIGNEPISQPHETFKGAPGP